MCDIIVTNPGLGKCRELVEHDLAHLKEDLEPLLSGQMRVGECVASGPWHDVTPAMISFHQRIIGTLEALLTVLQP
jgi:hypothetical protein